LQGITKKFIRRDPSPVPTGQADSPVKGEHYNIFPPLRAYGSEPTAHIGGDQGEGENNIYVTPSLTLPPQGGGKFMDLS